MPFIPKEEELDALVARAGKKLSAFLQLLKETAMVCALSKWVAARGAARALYVSLM